MFTFDNNTTLAIENHEDSGMQTITSQRRQKSDGLGMKTQILLPRPT